MRVLVVRTIGACSCLFKPIGRPSHLDCALSSPTTPSVSVTVPSEPTLRILTLSALRGIGPVAIKRIASIPGFATASPEELAAHVPALKKALAAENAWLDATKISEDQVQQAEADGARIVSGVDPDYPRLLLQTPDDPFLLFVKGKLARQPEKSVAVIGTREPTAHGELIARRITKFFAEHGWSIVSGLAIGCDAHAHKAALEHGAHTVAVLAHGLQMIAPSRHKGLAQEILDSGGALISEYRYGQGVQKQQYIKRDRIQAGMAQGVVMVQSDLVGGSLHASRASVEYGRWLAVPIATDRDREYGEPKVQANLLLANGDDRERSSLLRCSTQHLRRVFILRSRDDYVQLLTGEPVSVASNQPTASPESAKFDLEHSLPPQAEMLARALLARYQYIRAKIGEVETLQQCLSDPTTSLTSYDLDHELETVLHHLDRFAVQLAARAEAPVKESARQLREEVAALNKLLGPAIHQQIQPASLATVFTLFRALAERAFKEPELAQHLGSRAV